MMHDFDGELEAAGEGHYRTLLSENWSINNTPNGGYLMALLARTMGRKGCRTASKAIVTANYQERCDDTPADIFLEPVAASGNFVRLQARLEQGGRERVRAMATFMRPGADGNGGPRFYASPPEAVAPPERCVQVPSVPGYSLYDSIDLRLDPESAGWMKNRFSDRAVMKGWIRFKDSRPMDLGALALFADAFPPAVFASRGMVAWVPTIEYSVNIRQLPETEAVKGIFSSRFISEGLVEEDGELWDGKGNLLCISRQIAKYQPVQS